MTENKFINSYNKNNFYTGEYNYQKILGIGISISNKYSRLSHYVGIFKCGNKYYYYDNQSGTGILRNDKTFIEINVDFNFCIKSEFDDIFSKINQMYSDSNHLENYYIDEIHVFYLDTFNDEKDYYSKIKNNYIYYYSIYTNNKLTKIINENLDYIYNNKNNYEYSFLIIACFKNDIEFVKNLLSYDNININDQSYRKETALFAACYNNSNEIIELLARNINLNIYLTDDNGKYPLLILFEKKNIDAIKILEQFIKYTVTLDISRLLDRLLTQLNEPIDHEMYNIINNAYSISLSQLLPTP